MKILLLLLILFICTFIGWQIKRQYVLKTRHYAELLEFCVYCKNQISFLNTDRHGILSGFISKRESVIKESILGNNVGYLKSEDNDEINNFLKSIGTFAIDGEIKNIDYYIEIFTLKRENAAREEKTKGELCFKLSLLFGLLICIVLF